MDVDDGCPSLVDKLTCRECGLVSHLTISVEAQSSTTLHRFDGIFNDGCITIWLSACTAKKRLHKQNILINYGMH